MEPLVVIETFGKNPCLSSHSTLQLMVNHFVLKSWYCAVCLFKITLYSLAWTDNPLELYSHIGNCVFNFVMFLTDESSWKALIWQQIRIGSRSSLNMSFLFIGVHEVATWSEWLDSNFHEHFVSVGDLS